MLPMWIALQYFLYLITKFNYVFGNVGLNTFVYLIVIVSAYKNENNKLKLL